VQVLRLRRKLETDPSAPRVIKTEREHFRAGLQPKIPVLMVVKAVPRLWWQSSVLA
jgi:hypothetical protein